ncbi:hypothetical protein [Deinococcus petrolearius]|uniref:Uncharacterized protein n=1 Tax=Deinococcus petrolearius TaxID=1751295 RepID=A0ABW1DPB6_9DEIO
MASLSLEHNDRRIQEFIQEGLVGALPRAIGHGCANEERERYSRFSESMFNRRVQGVMRWTHVDQALYDMAPRFGFEPRRVRVGPAKFPEMFMIQRGPVIISAHHIRGSRQSRAPKYALHREELMPPAQGLLLASEEQLQAQAEWTAQPNPVEFWTATYHMGHGTEPEWMTLGRPARGQRDLFYFRDLYALSGHVPQTYDSMILNPPTEIPTINFALPSIEVTEGEGDK